MLKSTGWPLHGGHFICSMCQPICMLASMWCAGSRGAQVEAVHKTQRSRDLCRPGLGDIASPLCLVSLCCQLAPLPSRSRRRARQTSIATVGSPAVQAPHLVGALSDTSGMLGLVAQLPNGGGLLFPRGSSVALRLRAGAAPEAWGGAMPFHAIPCHTMLTCHASPCHCIPCIYLRLCVSMRAGTQHVMVHTSVSVCMRALVRVLV